MSQPDNELITYFPDSRIEILDNDRKVVHIRLTDYFTLSFRNLAPNKTVNGIAFKLLYKGIDLGIGEIILNKRNPEIQFLLYRIIQEIDTLISDANKTNEYAVHISNQEYINLVNRCLNELRDNNAGAMMLIFGKSNIKVSNEDVNKVMEHIAFIKRRDVRLRNTYNSLFTGLDE